MKDEERNILKVDQGASGIKTVKMDFPSNAHSKKEAPEGARVQKVIQGKVIKRKKSFGKRISEVFVKEDVDSVSSYIIHDVLVPALKDTIADMVKGGIEMMLFGEKQGRNTTRNRGKSYVSYNSYSNGQQRREQGRDQSYRNRARHNFDDITWPTRGEAEEVLSQLVDLTVDYNEATVGDLYDLAGISGTYTDRDYGWKNLASASVSRVREGYILNLPRPINLN